MRYERLALVGLAALPLVAQQGGGGGGGDIDVTNVLMWVVFGAIVGIVARLIIPNTGGMSWVLTIVVGILGAVIGGWLAGNVFEETQDFDWLASIIVAAILVWVVSRMGAGRRRTI